MGYTRSDSKQPLQFKIDLSDYSGQNPKPDDDEDPGPFDIPVVSSGLTPGNSKVYDFTDVKPPVPKSKKKK